MECYLDNSATTRCLDSAAALMAGILCTDYGNPSSLHHKGVQAEEYVRHAREVIAKTLKVRSNDNCLSWWSLRWYGCSYNQTGMPRPLWRLSFQTRLILFHLQ